jgi:hypothetical protein
MRVPGNFGGCNEKRALPYSPLLLLYLTPYLRSARVIYGASEGGSPASRAF